MQERHYQAYLVRTLKELFPGCVVLKNDSSYLQGFPDLTILYNRHWAVLEVKISEDAPEQENQRYYVDLLDSMSFAAFISPEVEEEVLSALQRTFKSRRATRVPKR